MKIKTPMDFGYYFTTVKFAETDEKMETRRWKRVIYKGVRLMVVIDKCT